MTAIGTIEDDRNVEDDNEDVDEVDNNAVDDTNNFGASNVVSISVLVKKSSSSGVGTRDEEWPPQSRDGITVLW